METIQGRTPTRMTSMQCATRCYQVMADRHPEATPAQIRDMVKPYMRRLIQAGLIIITD